jgi:glycosyltransferase involved in cell wall biosynthesis
MDQPLISLITVCYNAAPLMRNTLQSAIDQTYKNIELVIVDGGSKDNTVAEAQQFSKYIGTLISEPDKGIYDAMNKGIKAAKGEWVYFLNAGDAFFDNQVLESLFTNRDLNGYDLVYAKIQTVNEPTGINYIGGHHTVFSDFYFRYPVCHQATFTRRKAFEYIGLFDTSLRINADNKWQISFFKDYADRALFIDRIVAFYDIQGTSYHRRMKGYREFLRYTASLLPLPVYVLNVLLYPVIWAKVKFIRTFQETSWFKAYRNLKFRGKTA